MGSMAPRRETARSKPKKSAEAVVFAADEVPIRDDIAQLAYSLWEARGRTGGSAEEDWYRAEQEILARSRT
jgi:Protein of unknown function (DUF2934)